MTFCQQPPGGVSPGLTKQAQHAQRGRPGCFLRLGSCLRPGHGAAQVQDGHDARDLCQHCPMSLSVTSMWAEAHEACRHTEMSCNTKTTNARLCACMEQSTLHRAPAGECGRLHMPHQCRQAQGCRATLDRVQALLAKQLTLPGMQCALAPAPQCQVRLSFTKMLDCIREMWKPHIYLSAAE